MRSLLAPACKYIISMMVVMMFVVVVMMVLMLMVMMVLMLVIVMMLMLVVMMVLMLMLLMQFFCKTLHLRIKIILSLENFKDCFSANLIPWSCNNSCLMVKTLNIFNKLFDFIFFSFLSTGKHNCCSAFNLIIEKLSESFHLLCAL